MNWIVGSLDRWLIGSLALHDWIIEAVQVVNHREVHSPRSRQQNPKNSKSYTSRKNV